MTLQDRIEQQPETKRQLGTSFVLICILLGALSTALGYQLGEIEWYYIDRLNGGPHYPIHMQLLDQFSRIQLDIRAYQEKHGNPPAQLNLVDLPVYTASYETHDFDPHGQPRDPWMRPFIYQLDGSETTFASLGRDGIQGGQGLDTDLSSSSDREMTRFELPPISLMEFLRNRKLFTRNRDYITIDDPEWYGYGCAILTIICLAQSFWIRLRKNAEVHQHGNLWVGWRLLSTPFLCTLAFPFLMIGLYIALTCICVWLYLLWLLVWFIFTGEYTPPSGLGA